MTQLLPGVAEAFADLGDTIYKNTASTAAGSRPARAAFERAVSEWSDGCFDWARGEIAAGEAGGLYAELISAPPTGVALIPSVGAVAGLVANHLTRSGSGGNVVVGELEFTSNLYAWRLLENKGSMSGSFRSRTARYRSTPSPTAPTPTPDSSRSARSSHRAATAPIWAQCAISATAPARCCSSTRASRSAPCPSTS